MVLQGMRIHLEDQNTRIQRRRVEELLEVANGLEVCPHLPPNYKEQLPGTTVDTLRQWLSSAETGTTEEETVATDQGPIHQALKEVLQWFLDLVGNLEGELTTPVIVTKDIHIKIILSLTVAAKGLSEMCMFDTPTAAAFGTSSSLPTLPPTPSTDNDAMDKTKYFAEELRKYMDAVLLPRLCARFHGASAVWTLSRLVANMPEYKLWRRNSSNVVQYLPELTYLLSQILDLVSGAPPSELTDKLEKLKSKCNHPPKPSQEYKHVRVPVCTVDPPSG
jgi:hypothetical protein